METPITMAKFEEILPRICTRDTSADPKGWKEENPFWGQSDVVALLAQGLFGGVIAGVSLKNTKFAKLDMNFWNCFSDGTEKDFTRSQFGDEYPGELARLWWEHEALLVYPLRIWRLKLLTVMFQVEQEKIK